MTDISGWILKLGSFSSIEQNQKRLHYVVCEEKFPNYHSLSHRQNVFIADARANYISVQTFTDRNIYFTHISRLIRFPSNFIGKA